MKVTKDTLDNSQIMLHIEMEPPEMEEAMTVAYRHLVKKANIPGFRKGKTPRSILESYLGKAAFLEEAIEHAIPQAYNKALDEQQIDAIARPQIEITGTEPLSFKATVSLRPTITLGDYRNIRVPPETAEVKDEEIDKVVEQLRTQQVMWEPVDREAKLGDLVTMDIRAHRGDKPLLDQKGVEVKLVQDSPYPTPGFAEKIDGLKKGEEREFSLAIRGRADEESGEGNFKVSLSEVKEGKLPELNDDFVRGLGLGLEDLPSLKEKIASSLKAQAEEREHLRLQNAFIEEAVNLSQVSYPPVLVESEVDRILDEQTRMWQQGGGNLDTYLKNTGKTEDEVREELRPQATTRVVRSLVLGKIAEEEKTAVEPAEIDSEIERMLQLSKEGGEERRKTLNQPAARAAIERVIFNRKVLERVEQIARGETTGKEKEEVSSQKNPG